MLLNFFQILTYRIIGYTEFNMHVSFTRPKQIKQINAIRSSGEWILTTLSDTFFLWAIWILNIFVNFGSSIGVGLERSKQIRTFSIALGEQFLKISSKIGMPT